MSDKRLQIRCSNEVRVRFKEFSAKYDDYEAALVKLLDTADLYLKESTSFT